MSDIDKRLRYFDGQFLQAVDFNAEQAYHLDRQRRHNRLLHSYGIAEGLNLSVSQDKTTVSISPGTAIDGQGRQIVLPANVQISLQGQSAFQGKTLLAVVGYLENPADKANVGLQDFTRFAEAPDVKLVIDDGNAPPADTYLRVARLTISAGSLTVTGTPDLSVRVVAGAKLPSDVPIQNLRLSNPQVDPAQWPVLSSTGPQTSVLTGTLAADDVFVNKDVSLLGHLKDPNNPHGTTAFQVGSPTSVGGVSNPGGAIAIVAGNGGLGVSSDQGNKRVVLTPNAPSALAGISNPGGNIAMAAGNAISLTADNGVAKRIVISETHSVLTGNPHGTLASQLPDYDLGQRFIAYLVYSSSNANGSSQTITVGYPVHTLWVTGMAYATLAGSTFGGVISGFADLRSGALNQHSYGPSVTRQNANPTLTVSAMSGAGSPSYIARVTFFDYTPVAPSPALTADLGVRVSNVSPTGVTFTFDRIGNLTTFTLALSVFMVG